MKDQTFTMMVVSGNQQTVSRFQVHRRGIALIFGLFALCSLAVLSLTVHYSLLMPGIFDATTAREENEELRRTLALLQGKTDRMNKKLASLTALHDGLRQQTDVQDQGQKGAIGPLTSPANTIPNTRHHVEGFAFPAAVEDNPRLQKGLLVDHVNSLLRQSDQRLGSLRQLKEYYLERETLLASIPSIWPSDGYFMSGFGNRRDPFTGMRKMHQGIDIAGPEGTPVIAPAAATVIYVGDAGGYGNMIALDHGNGLVSRYGHLSRILIKMGSRVKRGDHIGSMGNTGRSTGPHLHYEVRKHGVAMDPTQYVLNW